MLPLICFPAFENRKLMCFKMIFLFMTGHIELCSHRNASISEGNLGHTCSCFKRKWVCMYDSSHWHFAFFSIKHLMLFLLLCINVNESAF